MTILIIVAVVFLVFLLGILVAWLFTKADHIVTGTKLEMVAEQQAYNPAMTLGHEIKASADFPTQMKEAVREAARKAASVPRGGNYGIGSEGNVLTRAASKGLKDDPVTAVRIAQYHGWDGVRQGIPADGVPVAAAVAAAPVAAAVGATGELEVVAGRDYVEIPITDAMSPEEVRKARVANAKARSAALKAAKAAPAGPAQATAPMAAAGVAVAAAAPVAVGIEPPKLIAITEGMAPEEVRKARVANAKAEAAYQKALKAAGATGGAVAAAAAPAPAAAAAPASATAPATAAAAAGIPAPKLVEITDSMSPEEVRKARVDNAKAQSAYNKALKAAGVDPAAVAAGATAATAAVAEPVVAAAPIAQAAPAAAPAPAGPSPEAAGIPKPKLVEITESMSPEEVRRARVENAKAQSAYNKALKAAGIDPASVK